MPLSSERFAQQAPPLTSRPPIPPVQGPPIPPRPPFPPQSEECLPRRPVMRARKWVSVWLPVYSVTLALIGFWPVHVDSRAAGMLAWVSVHVPILTPARIEFGANILLFVPFGVGLALLLPQLRHLVIPAALLASLAIEAGQALILPGRTPSIYDILANVSGAAVGLIGLEVVEAMKRRSRSKNRGPAIRR